MVLSEMVKRALRNMMNPKPVPVAIPEGWALVPVEPTTRILEAGRRAVSSTRQKWWCMIDAAPVPPVLDDGPRLRARIDELEATVARLRAEAKGLEDLL